MRFILSILTAAAAVLYAQTAVRADYIWATVANGQVRFALLENANAAPKAQYEKYVANLSPRSGGKTLTLSAPREGARFAALPPGQGIVTAESIVGVRERGGETYLLVYNARGAASLTDAATMTKAPAELLARRDGDRLIVSVRQEGWPVPESEVWLQWPGEDAPQSVQTNINGDATIPWPKEATRPETGFVSIRAKVNEAKAGVADGKRYPAVRRWATLTFPVSGGKLSEKQGDGAQTAKSFSQILRASYANNHEVVGGAAFNKTLFAGALTKQQLETHLQQRALVHNELHRILIQADPVRRVPYGPAQKNVLILLFTDLIAMGSGWPTEAQAQPLTRSFLKEIRESESKGPFFALGVQHVYYGGITNGGRMIGAKIGETLNFTPTYYQKSDGYQEYLAQVNKISDSAAHQEMIRGGQAAYRYIIASSNEDVFKAKEARN